MYHHYAASRPLRVLIIDDNRDAADSLVTLLKAFGHQPRACYDGESALRLAAELAPEALILDIGLPDMDGYEVARRLRRLDGLADALLVALTGYGRAEDRRLASEAGFDAHVTKPANLKRLLRLLAGTAETLAGAGAA